MRLQRGQAPVSGEIPDPPIARRVGHSKGVERVAWQCEVTLGLALPFGVIGVLPRFALGTGQLCWARAAAIKGTRCACEQTPVLVRGCGRHRRTLSRRVNS